MKCQSTNYMSEMKCQSTNYMSEMKCQSTNYMSEIGKFIMFFKFNYIMIKLFLEFFLQFIISSRGKTANKLFFITC